MNIINDLQAILASDNLLIKDEELSVFECDGLSAYKQKPLAVALPNNISEIKQILKVCKKHNIPIVTRGAGTGLSGGALPLENGVLLVLSKLNKILTVDIDRRIAVVEPGVINIQVTEKVDEYGLYYAPDPSSQIACTIGGNVAENAGGVHCLKYGLTVNNVLSIKFLTIDGDEILLKQNQDGLDLLALLNGSEGLLGIITEIELKLTPKPETAKLITAGFSKVENCANAVKEIIKHGIIPAGLEMMDELAIRAAEDFVQAGYPINAKALLLCELDGNKTQVLKELKVVSKILKDIGAEVIKKAKNNEERLKLWQGRKAAFPAIGRISPDYYCIDGTIPRRKLAQILQAIAKLSQQYNLSVANVFHAGDGNLHPLILYDANKAGELEKTEELGEKILNLCVDYGGNITGEHGVGVEKLNSMCAQFNNLELTVFHNIKKAFDPKNLLNPGKAIPSLHRCAELGKMHVHNNNLPFSELERF